MLKQEVVSFGCMWCQPRKKFNRTNNSKLTYHPENLLWKSISCILWIKIEFVAKLTNSIPYSVLVVVVVLDNFSQRLKTVNVELFDGFHHLCNEHNEIYHLGAEIGNRSDFFLQLVIHQKKFCHSPATLSAKSCLVFAIWFLSIAMFTILESSMHLLAWSKALISSQNLLFWIVDSPGWHLAV